jgi:hypothetical protein
MRKIQPTCQNKFKQLAKINSTNLLGESKSIVFAKINSTNLLGESKSIVFAKINSTNLPK